MNPTTGSILSNRYTLTERIAVGGMGQVWAATDTVLGRTVAVKLLSPALSQESSFVERFRAEARHTASLHHPNITTVFDYGEDDGSAYLVMELVAGQPLSQIIAERAPLSTRETASILIQAATALEAAHQGGVIHRDVKPANILITPDGTAKLTDFGIARLVDNAPLTQTGQVLGTAQYLSPEQAVGHGATVASDLYALGVVGHEMLTGQRPFDRDTVVATALAHVNQPLPELPESVPIGIRNVITAALAKDPADRPSSAAAMAHALGMPDAAFVSGAATATTAFAAPTTVLPVLTLPARTQAMSAPGAPTTRFPGGAPSEPPGTRDRHLGPLGPRRAWLLGAVVAALVLGVLIAFALASGNGDVGTKTPTVPATATASSHPSPTTPAAAATTTLSPATLAPAVVPTPPPTTQGSTAASSPAPTASTPPVVSPPAVSSQAPQQGNGGRGNQRGGKQGNNGDQKDGN
jgi:serine/threonine-protein kinase